MSRFAARPWLVDDARSAPPVTSSNSVRGVPQRNGYRLSAVGYREDVSLPAES
jgi:hypothetical protein